MLSTAKKGDLDVTIYPSANAASRKPIGTAQGQWQSGIETRIDDTLERYFRGNGIKFWEKEKASFKRYELRKPDVVIDGTYIRELSSGLESLLTSKSQ